MAIAVVIPAYNEEKTIGNVLEVLVNIDIITDIIVVSDGSEDNTVNVAKDFNVKVIELKKNMGKSYAVLKGVNSTDAQIIMMLDADLIGLRKEHIDALLEPILKKEADMTIGVFKYGRGATDLAQKIAPYLSGQRAINRSIFERLQNYKVRDYGIEMALKLMTDKEKIRVKEVCLKDLTHVMKEEKRGFLIGLMSRLKMYIDIIYCAIRLKIELRFR